jgi:aminodeoxyfutalosine deaminase
MLVHAVHMDEGDWDAVVRSGCFVCFCPRSNHNLNVGRPNVAEALRRGIPLAIGTDSLAGNSDLSLFAEAVFMLQQYPEAHPGSVLKMLTLGGARALGRDDLFGSIEPGKRARLLSVFLPGPVSASQLAEIIIHQGNKGSWQWASQPANA